MCVVLGLTLGAVWTPGSEQAVYEVVDLDFLSSRDVWRVHRGRNLSLLFALPGGLRGLELLASRLVIVPISLCLALPEKDLI